MIEILSLVPLAVEKLPEFEAAGFSLELAEAGPGLADDIRRRAIPARGIVTSGMKGVDAAAMDALPELSIICTLGAGYDRIDIAAAHARNIVVTSGADANSDSVADHAMALLFASVRGIVGSDRQVHAGAGADWTTIRTVRPGLWGKKLGIVGMGRIGSRVARRGGDGFNMEVGYHNRGPAESSYRYFADVTELAAWCDFLVVTLPGKADCHHIIGRPVLDALGPRGFLVNVGRGRAVDTEALATALNDGAIGGAGLDVFEGEPILPDSLSGFDNLTLTPHIAGRSFNSVDQMFRTAIGNLRAHFDGAPLLTPPI